MRLIEILQELTKHCYGQSFSALVQAALEGKTEAVALTILPNRFNLIGHEIRGLGDYDWWLDLKINESVKEAENFREYLEALPTPEMLRGSAAVLRDSLIRQGLRVRLVYREHEEVTGLSSLRRTPMFDLLASW